MAFAFILGDRYRAHASPVHSADGRVKLVAALAYIFLVTLTPEAAWGALAALALPVVLVAALARLTPLLLVQRSLLALPFVMAAVPLAFTRPGETLFAVPLLGWTASREGAEAVATIMTRAWIAVLVAAVLTATTTAPDLVRALRGIGVPRLLAAVVFFTYRYLFAIGDEGLRLMRGRDSRSARIDGYRSGGTIGWRARVLGSMVGTLFLRSFERSERVFAAMQSRGYDGEPRFLHTSQVRARDVLGAAVLLLFAAAVQGYIRVA